MAGTGARALPLTCLAISILALCTAGGAPTPAAADGPRAVDHRPNFEWRLGLLYHEDSRFKRAFGTQDTAREGGLFDLNAEILFGRPAWHFDNPLVHHLLTPRFRLGTSINLGEGTNQLSAGLAWDFYVTGKTFIEGSFGIAVHDGYTGSDPLHGGRLLGCSPLARQSLTLGRDITQRVRIMFTTEHLDNFELCRENAGLTNLGVRIGFRR